ncbi:hypothetical protein PSEUBRA_003238 [Kalmanozyma brasiliensis GHG001]|uniref:Uncharacterized protein n=1 Tax=Kalmanozyma brasiliensis (strain GHG001) TaxID=1365824 RepID=V5GN67_KALBG|nr:uncharacterized protein PSEUBRA_003238 [Kalmanozyma brasiliensis GHG001]EST07412.1 hypothetical protein PSEUBRA_003238 [Kalmanozyma brasiliensis GHG001]
MHLFRPRLVLVALASSTLARPAPPNPAEGSFWAMLSHVARSDTDAFLASRFPHVPVEQRARIGDVPSNLWGLVQGTDASGRLILPTPPPGHVLLLTTSVPPTHTVSNPAYLLRGRPGKSTVRGLGLLTLPDGTQRTFRTVAFDPLPSSAGPLQGGVVDRTHHVPPRSFDAGLFGARKLTVSHEGRTMWRPKDKVMLAHVSVLPLDGPGEREMRVYPDAILREVLAGPSGRHAGLVQWSDGPELKEKGKVREGTRLFRDWKKWVYANLPRLSPGEGAAGTSSQMQP